MAQNLQMGQLSPENDKRVVMLQTSGPYAGLYQIVGTVSELKAEMGELPELQPGVRVPPNQREVIAGRVAFKARYVLYKEVYGPKTMRYGSMDPRQA